MTRKPATKVRTLTLMAAMLALSACDREPTMPGAPEIVSRTNLRPRTAAELKVARELRGEEIFAEVERRLPGAGGLFIDKDGVMTVWVASESDEARARNVIGPILSRRGILAPKGRLERVRVRRGKYTFTQLEAWRDQIFDEIFTQMHGLTTLDLAESQNRIVIGVATGNASARRLLEERIRERGIDPDAVIINYEAPPRYSYGMFNSPPGDLRNNSEIIVGGLSYGWEGRDKTCSVGVGATWNGQDVIISAGHCSAQMFTTDGGTMKQNMRSDGNVVGVELYDPSGWSCGIFTCRRSDAAVFSFDPGSTGVQLKRGTIARPSAMAVGAAGPQGVDGSNPYFRVTDVEHGDLLEGQTIEKVGVATGWTQGVIFGTCSDVHFSAGWYGAFGNQVIRCEYKGSYYSDGGDSGGPVFVRLYGGTNVLLAGIHNAIAQDNTDGRFSKWSSIKLDLGGSLNPTDPVYVDNTPHFGVYITGSQQLYTGVQGSWSAVPSLGQPPYNCDWSIDSSPYWSGSCDYPITQTFSGPSSHTIDVVATDAAGESVPAPFFLVQVGSCEGCSDYAKRRRDQGLDKPPTVPATATTKKPGKIIRP